MRRVIPRHEGRTSGRSIAQSTSQRGQEADRPKGAHDRGGDRRAHGPHRAGDAFIVLDVLFCAVLWLLRLMCRA